MNSECFIPQTLIKMTAIDFFFPTHSNLTTERQCDQVKGH